MYHIKNNKRSLQSSQMILQALEELLRAKAFEDISGSKCKGGHRGDLL